MLGILRHRARQNGRGDRRAGAIVAMEPAADTNWLALRGIDETLARQGARLFRELGCSFCHFPTSTVHAPSLVGLHGRLVHLMDGTAVVADRQYLMDSIPLPKKQIVAGSPPVMPSFAGQVSEEELIKLIASIESLSRGPAEWRRSAPRSSRRFVRRSRTI